MVPILYFFMISFSKGRYSRYNRHETPTEFLIFLSSSRMFVNPYLGINAKISEINLFEYFSLLVISDIKLFLNQVNWRFAYCLVS